MRRYTTSWARKQLAAPSADKVIAPMQRTWNRRRLRDRTDPRPAVRVSQRSKWPKVSQKYWWRLATGTEVHGTVRASITGNSCDAYCAWCSADGRFTRDSIDHQLDDCPAWTALRAWLQARSSQGGQHTEDYGDFLINGRTRTGGFASGGLHAARGVALRVMCSMQTKGRMTGPTYWPPANAARTATKLLAREARSKHLAATNEGGDAVAIFAKQWRGMVRTRRNKLDVLFT
jgi:hypothetical protein